MEKNQSFEYFCKTNNKLDKSNTFDCNCHKDDETHDDTTCECHKDDCKSCKKNNNSSKDLF